MDLRSLLLCLAAVPALAMAQNIYLARTGEVDLNCSTPLEKIEGLNHKATSVIDASKNAIEFSVLIKAFEFEKALMQEHFNENYMESNTYPKATFKGTYSGVSADELAKPGMHEVTVEGDLTIHGVTKHITTKGTLGLQASGALRASCDLVIKPEDYGIQIPAVVRGKIAQEVQVKVRVDYQKK